jgi:hypothetical protein
VRWHLILAHPAVHGGDAVARLAHSGTLVLAYQLPLPQLLVFLARAADPDPTWTRLAFRSRGSRTSVFPPEAAWRCPPRPSRQAKSSATWRG